MKLHLYLRRRSHRSGEAGYFLIVMMLFLALIAIGLTAAAPAFMQSQRREREKELIHRGNAYARAIRLYYRKFGRYPVAIENLENTNNVRFLRKRFKDPMTADGNWRMIHFGEAQSLLAPANPVMPGATVLGGGTSGFGSSSGPGSTGQIMGGLTSSQPASGQPATGQTGSEASNSSQAGTPAAQLGTLQSGGATFGGGAIVGVASQSKKESIKELNNKNHYNDWEFVYDPRLDVGMGLLAPQGTSPQQGAPGVSLPPGSSQNPGMNLGPGMMSPGPQSPNPSPR